MLTLFPLFEDAPKTLKEAGREIFLSRSCNAIVDRYDRQQHKPQYRGHTSDYTVSV